MVKELEKYVKPGYYVNSDHPLVVQFVKERTDRHKSDNENLVTLYYAVRDEFLYDPYRLDLSSEAVKASHIISRDYGYCIEKSCLFAACARVIGIPSRMGFANVKNHIGTSKLQQLLQTDLLVFHGYAEVYLNGQWIKATPVFNKSLCEKLNVAPLEFDAASDSIFQQFDIQGGRFMEYVHDYGVFDDVPYDMFIAELIKHYPHLKEKILTHKSINLNHARNN